MATPSPMILDAENTLAIQYKGYCSKMRSLALSKPSTYYDLRAKILEEIESKMVKFIYTTFYQLLSKGLDTTGNPIGIRTGLLGADSFSLPAPCYPNHLINSFSISSCADMSNWISKAIDIIAPDDYSTIASGKLSLQGKASAIEDFTK